MHEAVSNLRRIFPAALVPRGHVPRPRAARAALHRVRDEALPRRRAWASWTRPPTPSWCAARRCSCAGARDELARELSARMAARRRGERFEDAARLRDQLAAVERTVERQQIVTERAQRARRLRRWRAAAARSRCRCCTCARGAWSAPRATRSTGVALDDGELIELVPRPVLRARPDAADPARGADAGRRSRTTARSRRCSASARSGASRCARRSAAPARELRRDGAHERGARRSRGGSRRARASRRRSPSCSERLGLCARCRAGSSATTSRRCTARSAVGSRVVFEDGQPGQAATTAATGSARRAPGDDYACLREVMRAPAGARRAASRCRTCCWSTAARASSRW